MRQASLPGDHLSGRSIARLGAPSPVVFERAANGSSGPWRSCKGSAKALARAWLPCYPVNPQAVMLEADWRPGTGRLPNIAPAAEKSLWDASVMPDTIPSLYQSQRETMPASAAPLTWRFARSGGVD